MNIDWQCCLLLSKSHDAALSQLSYFLYQCADKRRKQTRSSCKLAVQRHSDHPTFFFIRKEKTKSRFVSISRNFFSRPVRQVRNNFFTVLFWKIVVFMGNFDGNFLSSRKYDWNVVPRDLENTARPRRMRRIFFKKNKVYLLKLLLLRKINNIFSSCCHLLFLSLIKVINTSLFSLSFSCSIYF